MAMEYGKWKREKNIKEELIIDYTKKVRIFEVKVIKFKLYKSR